MSANVLAALNIPPAAGGTSDTAPGPPVNRLAPIAPPPGAAASLSLRLGQDFELGGGDLRLSSEATKKLLNAMLCLPARMSAVLSVELALGDGAAAPPAPKLTTLHVLYPAEYLGGGDCPLDGQHSRLRVGRRRAEWLGLQGELSSCPPSISFEYLFWRRGGGGPDGGDPVYCLWLSRGEAPPGAAPPAEVCDDSGAVGPAVRGPGAVRDAGSRGLGPMEAAAEFLGRLATPAAAATPSPRADSGKKGAEGRRRERSRSPERSRRRSRERSRNRSRAASPELELRARPPAVNRVTQADAAAWAAGTPCEDPGIVRRLTPPPPGTHVLFYQKFIDAAAGLSDDMALTWAFMMHSELFESGPARQAPFPSRRRRLRAVLVLGGVWGGAPRLVPTCFEWRFLLRWSALVEALGGLPPRSLLVFTFIGTYPVPDPSFADRDVIFFSVENRGVVAKGQRVEGLGNKRAAGRPRRHERSRSRSPRRRSPRRHERSRSRSPRRRSPRRHERSRSRSPRRRSPHRAGGSPHAPSPGHHLRAPQAAGPPPPASWAAGTPCLDPTVVARLVPPAPGRRARCHQKVRKTIFKYWIFVGFAHKVYDAARPPGARTHSREHPPEHPLRAMAVVKGRLVPLQFRGMRLMGWKHILDALGGVRECGDVDFDMIGTYPLPDPRYLDPDVLFFEVSYSESAPMGAGPGPHAPAGGQHHWQDGPWPLQGNWEPPHMYNQFC